MLKADFTKITQFVLQEIHFVSSQYFVRDMGGSQIMLEH